MNTTEKVTSRVLEMIREQYADDIAIAVSHTTLNIDRETKAVSYFVPVTDRGRHFARTFIYEGMGIDLWAIEWDRLEKFAALEEYNITCLADGEVLWARSEEDRRRFAELQKTQRKNLSDPVMMRKKALAAYGEAKSICGELLFADESGIRMGAGYVFDYLSQAIAFANGRYFRHSLMEQAAELAFMENVPEGFVILYDRMLRDRSSEDQIRLCRDAVLLVRDFLEAQKTPESADTPDFQVLAGWYAELAYTWLRIRTYAARGDLPKTYMWGALLQVELNTVCGEFNLPEMALMARFDPDDLPSFAAHADVLETEMRRILTEHGAWIPEYGTLDFLNDEV